MNLAAKISKLQNLSTAELAAEYERLHRRPPRYRSPAWMRKRIAYQLQVATYGGLSGPARAEIDRLASDVRLPDAAQDARGAGDEARGPASKPRAGTVLQREWRGQQIRVQVLDDGFEWNGDRYGSLSAVAHAITGAKWNGKLFFGLVGRAKA